METTPLCLLLNKPYLFTIGKEESQLDATITVYW
jgi:hypothetical protein